MTGQKLVYKNYIFYTVAPTPWIFIGGKLMTKEPEVQDYVKHKTADVTGIVTAKYLGKYIRESSPEIADMQFLDVRGDDEKMYWKTPAANWDILESGDNHG